MRVRNAKTDKMCGGCSVAVNVSVVRVAVVRAFNVRVAVGSVVVVGVVAVTAAVINVCIASAVTVSVVVVSVLAISVVNVGSPSRRRFPVSVALQHTMLQFYRITMPNSPSLGDCRDFCIAPADCNLTA